MRQHSLGLWFGSAAVLVWSFGSALVYFGARDTGTWSFIAIGSTSAALLQFGVRRVQTGEVWTALLLPWRLWAGPVLCFVCYGLVWPLALAASSPGQVFGTNLLNYLWPVLTVVFSAFLVPGVRLTPRTLLALGLAAAGLVLANAGEFPRLLARASGNGSWTPAEFLPYLLGLTAAVTWALYSALLARWRSWAIQYVTSPVGFLLIGVSAWIVLLLGSRGTANSSRSGLLWTLLYGTGPLAAGYLLWELALARTRVQTLSLLAAGIPVLSTAILCVFLRRMPGPELVLAAILVAAGVLLSRRE